MTGSVNVGRSGLWRPSVYPFLEQVGEQLEGHQPSEHSLAVDVEGVRILVTPLEQKLVRAMVNGDDENFPRKHILVRDGLGLRIKLLSELNQLAQLASPERAEIIEQINADVGLGCQLMHEITLEMKAITASGDMANAKLFSQYRQQLARIVAEAERRVADRGDEMFENTDSWVPTSYAPRVPKTDAAAKEKTAAANAKKSSRVPAVISWLLAIALLAAAAAAAYFFYL